MLAFSTEDGCWDRGENRCLWPLLPHQALYGLQIMTRADLDVRGAILKPWPTLPFQFFPRVSFGSLPILTLQKKEVIVFWGSCPGAQQEMIFGLPVRCRIEEALGDYVNGRNDSV